MNFFGLSSFIQPRVNPTPGPSPRGEGSRSVYLSGWFLTTNLICRVSPPPWGGAGGGVGTAEQNVTFKATIQRLTNSKNFNQLGSPAGGWVDTRPKKLNSTDLCVMDRLKAVGRVLTWSGKHTRHEDYSFLFSKSASPRPPCLRGKPSKRNHKKI